MKIAAIVQARLGSTRLPLKSLLSLSGLPIIDWAAGRLAASSLLNEVVVAIPDAPLDRALELHLKRSGIAYCTGPEDDVLRRFTLAADAIGADYVVRVCADNPLVWGGAIDRLIRFYFESECDYAWNHIPRDNMWPDGLGAEMASAALLHRLDEVARLPSQREHCFNYIWDNAGQFRMRTFDPEEGWLRRPDLKLDIDSAQDFLKLSLLNLSPDMDAAQIIAACDAAGA